MDIKSDDNYSMLVRDMILNNIIQIDNKDMVISVIGGQYSSICRCNLSGIRDQVDSK